MTGTVTGPMTGTMTAPMPGTARVWDALCRHIDGVAIGTTMAALHERGALAILTAQDRTEFGPLRERLAANAGFLHVALRLLADQGWVARQGEPGTDQMTIMPTARGRIVMTELAGAYPAAVRSLRVRVDGEPGPFGTLMRREWGLPAGVPPDVRHQVLSHLNGHLIAPVMHAVSSGEADIATSRGAAEILAAAGWARLDADVPELTQDGEIATSLARQYRYPVTYLPLLRQVPELIFGEPAKTDEGGEETHLDRELDLRFSGDVFTAACREPFLDLALPLFETAPLDRQPALVVDAGCGDGALLEALYLAVRERTARGRRLAERPLLMAGVDPSPVARRMASARLAAAGVPHVIMDGDIGDPAALERALAARGLDARDALHVCKSAIHDRAYEGPGPERSASPPAGAGAYALPDGSAIPASSVALDLARLFRRWLPVASRHGWLVIEAHAAPAAVLARLIGRTHATVLDATHGYACQYPVEPGVFAWAARAGGFVSRGHAEPGAATLGHTILTIDYFVADQTRTSQVL
ncbi:MAG TPA: class I SAM-dependent methyltransferase [Streptosporangiaceae bacterium]|nr:class I SAM-dependent methyltransferase [Streptosporangiaceae bacterium]